ncbi:MAG: archaeosortase/exosortase family protein [Verrucomicrobiota bacterium]
MPMRQQLAESFRGKSRELDFWIHIFLFGSLALAFWPLTQWFATSAHEQSRILHALIVLGLATVFLIRFGDVVIQETLSLNKSSRYTLVLTFVFLLASFVLGFLSSRAPDTSQSFASFGISLLTIAAYCSGIASGVLFVFGEGSKKITYTVCGTFGIFILLSSFMSAADWPLRTLAGNWSAKALTLLGQNTELGLLSQQGLPPKLILLVNEHPFHVASECNGFGIILTSLLIAVLLGFYRSLTPVNLALYVIAGIVLGFFFNTLRIVIIVLLAPSLMAHYDLMHEVVGGVTFWGCLILTWILLKGPIKDKTA